MQKCSGHPAQLEVFLDGDKVLESGDDVLDVGILHRGEWRRRRRRRRSGCRRRCDDTATAEVDRSGGEPFPLGAGGSRHGGGVQRNCVHEVNGERQFEGRHARIWVVLLLLIEIVQVGLAAEHDVGRHVTVVVELGVAGHLGLAEEVVNLQDVMAWVRVGYAVQCLWNSQKSRKQFIGEYPRVI